MRIMKSIRLKTKELQSNKVEVVISLFRNFVISQIRTIKPVVMHIFVCFVDTHL